MTEVLPHVFEPSLDAVQVRVLGALIEKEITTPEQYPLSLNALVNASNQRSSRDPVLDVREAEVHAALAVLAEMGLVATNRDARVEKYEHRARTVLNLRRDETALLCLLLLRGPQTPGELRARADRMYAFDDLAAVQATVERLVSRSSGASPGTPADAWKTVPLAVQLPRQPGARESRYAHLLGGAPAAVAPLHHGPGAGGEDRTERMERLEAEMETLRTQIGTLTERLRRLEATLPGGLL